MMQCMHRTNIYLERKQCEALDKLAKEEGTSRSVLVRRLIDQALSGELRGPDEDIDAIKQSFGILADVDVPTRRGPDERELHLTRIWAKKP